MTGADGLARGMDVLTSDGHSIGRIKEIVKAEMYFWVDCRFAPDYYVPLNAVARTQNSQVHLGVTKTEVANLGWEARPRRPA